jgi:hypothetical protein
MQNKRKHDRYDSLNLIHFACLDTEQQVAKQGMGRTLNVSQSGILLETSCRLAPRDTVTLTIGLADETVNIDGTVVRSTAGEHGRFESGISFFTIGERDQDILARYIQAFRNQ